MRTALRLLLTAIVIAAASGAEASSACRTPAPSPDDVAAITALENGWAAADSAGDSGWFAGNFAEQISVNGELLRRGDFVKAVEARRISSARNEIEPPMNIRVFGDVAVVTGVEHSAGRDARGNAFDRRIRFTDTLVRCGGRWIVVANHYSRLQ